MKIVRALIPCTKAAAAAEMALVAPLLIGLLFASFELGNYFWSEHVLVEGVRDGARYAARQSFSNYSSCSNISSGTVWDNTKALVRTGELSGGTDRLPNWNDGTTTFTVGVTCTSSVTTGIYSGTGTASGAPIVTVTASLPYRSLFGFVGLSSFRLNATEQSAVAGI